MTDVLVVTASGNGLSNTLLILSEVRVSSRVTFGPPDHKLNTHNVMLSWLEYF